MAMASLTSSLLARKGQARPSSHNITTDFRFKNDDAVELLMESQREEAAKGKKIGHVADTVVNDTVADNAPAAAQEPVKSSPQQTAVVSSKPVTKEAVAVETQRPKMPALPPADPADVARKTVRIRSDLDVVLRLFAARNHLSQKEIIEEALVSYLQDQRVDMSCICGAQD